MSAHQMIPATLVALVALVGCGPYGNGNKVRENREVGAFSRVENRGQLELVLQEGPQASAVVELDENLQELVEVSVRDGVLVVEYDHGFHYVGVGRVEVTSPQFVGALQDGSGQIRVEGMTRAEDLDLAVRGSGKLTYCGPMRSLAAHLDGSGELVACSTSEEPLATANFSLMGSGTLSWEGKAQSTDVLLDGSGAIDLEGEGGAVKAKLIGSGEIDAQRLSATAANFDVYGSGKILGTVNGDVSAYIEGSGHIEVWGNANLTSEKIDGSGHITRH